MLFFSKAWLSNSRKVVDSHDRVAGGVVGIAQLRLDIARGLPTPE